MGWESLSRWGAADIGEVLSGGVRNDVRLVEIDGRRAVARLGSRADVDLEWETSLLRHLSRAGLGVPGVWPTRNGKHQVDGLVVMDFVSGRPPETASDWKLVAEYLRRLHELTVGSAQRPGWASSVELLTRDSGTSIDLASMPSDAVERCRNAWSRISDRPLAVVHGDPNPGNIRISGDRVVLIDWDEARVDVPLLDLVLPANAAALPADELTLASQASSAWEAAVCWSAEPEYAAKRLAELTQ